MIKVKLMLKALGCLVPVVFFGIMFLVVSASIAGTYSGVGRDDPNPDPGTPPRTTPPPFIIEGPLRWPTNGHDITSYFGNRSNPTGEGGEWHWGVDVAVVEGTPVWAAHAGRVDFTGRAGGYGNLVILVRDDGFQTRYGHLSAFVAEEGQRVEAGDLIARSGNTGRSTGPHLHFETRINPFQAVDPLGYFEGGA